MKVSAALVSRLKPLVTLQRRLEKQLVPLEALQAKEADVRKHIDEILLANGFASGDRVRVGGYDVTHNERKGRTSLNADKLRGAGVADIDIAFATETGKPSQFATVKPAKGATVRAA